MAINDSQFLGTLRESNRDYARGWSSGARTFMGGITYPEENKLRPGLVLMRIGHSRDAAGNAMPDWVNLTSPWWMTSSTFLDIVGRGEDAGTEMNQMFRMKLALTPDFGVSDTIFWVRTKQSFRSWAGRARPVMEDPNPVVREKQGRPLGWLGGWEVVQNFIPGLRDFATNAPTSAALDGFEVLPKVSLSSYATLRNGGFNPLKWPWPA
ncbi:hypothetical protein [Roseococcus pinisoli]|uniref:Uncharacterized protein n=1 Tax=Roseococcus pinisoli TaxID=2835040 RepID=A0ABS5Q836_9PROT|nr:hypothetical protein [Roseococcus pinisoli]MBS7809847.1 hypothetical protein [Roseococcus pinisoli]